MPTLHRRNGSVKYVPPKRLLEGLRPAVAIPATLFAGLVVAAIALAMHKTPNEQKWVNLRPEDAWRPAMTEQGGAPPADERFLFTSALERGRTPRATQRLPADSSPTLAPAAGRTILARDGRLVVEHTIGRGPERRFVRSEWSGIEHYNTAPGMSFQRGEVLAEGVALTRQMAAELESLPVASRSAPEIREGVEAPAVNFGS